ncbi:ATP-dependent nuclease [Dysgonomonas massiliensis]|uniref:ATP-dependent nuclease n=1 Tax=Dysgonomonas massiliensis TaxID=2040292 RepID=UPI000C75649A|nr:AAA family ATPase [Dysgonomonas massiliensis]
MKLSRLDISNFRKLKQCKIEIAERETIFVGANNSGKTSAMDCLRLFLDKSKENNSFTTYDFTLNNWIQINEIGKRWETIDVKEFSEDDKVSLLSEWNLLLPQLDVWLEVSESKLYQVHKILPSLDWEGGKLGLRLRFEPKDITKLLKDYQDRRANVKKLNAKDVELWPNSLLDFLKKGNKLNEYFTIKAYILPSELYDNKELDQNLTNNPLDFDPLKGLIRVDIINAQRGLRDSNDKDTGYESLSSQLRKYYDRHLNPDEFIEASDIEAIKASENAKAIFDDKIGIKFNKSLKELEKLNYPTFGSPNINLTSKLNPIEGYYHESVVLFDLLGKDFDRLLKLSETHNGLGYQNLISMTFKLMAFRDEWMKVGKASKDRKENEEFEPLHVVLIEEPEAHLHAQVQQVFIKEAYSRLRDHENLGDNNTFKTQLIVSTHSNHIVEQVDFSSLRYFKRDFNCESIPTSTIVNLSHIFDSDEDAIRFAKRYLKLTHADLFFADAVILVEGLAEKLLVPLFIKDYYEKLNSAYISILEIGGRHAHTLQSLIEQLGIITLIITDIDAVQKDDKRKKEKVEIGKDLYTGNGTLKAWLPQKELIDDLLSTNTKISSNNLIRIAYQYKQNVTLGSEILNVYPNTFEDALIFENIDLIKENKIDNSIMKISNLLTEDEDIINAINTEIYNTINKSTFKKAEFALDLLYLDGLKPPQYIKEGLDWLQDTLLQLNKQINERK